MLMLKVKFDNCFIFGMVLFLYWHSSTVAATLMLNVPLVLVVEVIRL